MAESSIARARRLAKEKREAREAAEAAEAAAAAEKSKPKAKKKSSSIIDAIRAAFSSEDDISRIDSAVEAMESGIADADKDNR